MENVNNGLAALILMAVLLVGVFGGALIFRGSGVKIVEVDKLVIQEKLVETPCPACPIVTCPNVLIPEIENADNALLNEFLEDTYWEEYEDIEDAAYDEAVEELEDHDYRVVVDYMMSLVEGIDEDSMENNIDVDDFDVKVTMLGLEDEADKSARVTFEIEVSYRFEEGVNTKFNKDLVVVYDVVFEEGEFDDEEVEFVSIL